MDKKIEQKAWHSMTVESLLNELETSNAGLANQQADKRRREWGKNQLTQKKGDGLFVILLRQLHNPLIYVLLAATALSLLMGKYTDAVVVFAVIVINTVIGLVQEYQAENTVRALMQLAPEKVTVVRDNKQVSLNATDLVPGDYVLLQAGDRVPADCRITMARNVTVNESILTGESLPVDKKSEPNPVDTPLPDRSNMLFSGTLVANGVAEAVVVDTAARTEIGKISSLIEETKTAKSPLTKSIAFLGRFITISVIIVSAILIAIGLFRGYALVDALFSALTLAVATVPEGLPAVVTIATAIGVRRMAASNAIIRNLPSVETLGSTTVICSDKTGTLTKNEMNVDKDWMIDADVSAREELYRCAMLCNDASIEHGQETTPTTIGDPTEVALLIKAQDFFGEQTGAMASDYPRLDEIPFDSDTKLMATLHAAGSLNNIIMAKGAPASIMAIIDSTYDKEAIRNAANQMASEGTRVLAFAKKTVSENDRTLVTEDLRDLQFLGLIGMSDPPRYEVKDAISICHRAGISIKMITGDHPQTAMAIGKELGLKDSSKHLTGKMLENLDGLELQKAAASHNIFARVSPEDKLKLVTALQEEGEIVAMTGDGVNDAPALKKADIGVAMGITGTSVAKSAADMILADDNFTSIQLAVKEGRRVYDNLLKSLIFLLPTSVGLGMVILIAVLFFPSSDGVLLQPMQPVQVLWINLITAVALTLPLALEVPEPDIMNRPPRNPRERLFNTYKLIRLLVVALFMGCGTVGLFLYEYNLELSKGVSAEEAASEAQTMAVLAMVLFQVFYLLDCRSLRYSIFKIGLFSNPYIYVGILIVLLAQIGFVYLPFMNRWFHSSPLPADSWIISWVAGVLLYIIVSLEKKVYAATTQNKR